MGIVIRLLLAVALLGVSAHAADVTGTSNHPDPGEQSPTLMNSNRVALETAINSKPNVQTHATDCTLASTTGFQNQDLCHELDDDKICVLDAGSWVCAATGGGGSTTKTFFVDSFDVADANPFMANTVNNTGPVACASAADGNTCAHVVLNGSSVSDIVCSVPRAGGTKDAGDLLTVKFQNWSTDANFATRASSTCTLTVALDGTIPNVLSQSCSDEAFDVTGDSMVALELSMTDANSSITDVEMVCDIVYQ